MDIRQWHVLQWSNKQQAFHEDTVERMLEDNRKAMRGETRNPDYDWIPVYLAETPAQWEAWRARNDPRPRPHP